MLAERRQLEIDIENVEARMKMIEVAKTTSDFNFDDSQLARTKELIDNISTRLDVAEKLVNTNVPLYDRIPLDEEETDDNVVEQVTRYFAADPQIDTLADAERVSN